MPSHYKDKEKIHRAGGADPRSGEERVFSVLNRIAQGNKDQIRRFDDTDEQMEANRKASKAKKKK